MGSIPRTRGTLIKKSLAHSHALTRATTNNWYQIVGTYDGATIKLYVNNTLAQSTSYTPGTPLSSSGHGIRLMRRWDNADYWGGRLAIVRIYSGDIGLSGVTQNFDAQRGRFGI